MKNALIQNHINIRMPYTAQGKLSANCGPCSLKMLLDYYKVSHPKSHTNFTIPSLNKFCKVSKAWGTEISQMRSNLARFGLKRTKVEYRQIEKYISLNIPILCLHLDELGEGHYSILKGITYINRQKHYVFQDPYWGRNFKRKAKKFKLQAAYFNHWLWAIEKKQDIL